MIPWSLVLIHLFSKLNGNVCVSEIKGWISVMYTVLVSYRRLRYSTKIMSHYFLEFFLRKIHLYILEHNEFLILNCF